MATKKKEQGFEESLQRLNDILALLEDPDLGVEKSLKLYEQGIALVRSCEQKLSEVKQKITYIDEELSAPVGRKDEDNA